MLLLTPTGAPPGVAILTILVGAASLVVRFRLAGGIERQQLRWVALAAGLTGVAMGAVAVLVVAGSLELASWAGVLYLILLPLATGVAILPARRRVQAVVDRRFDRRRYDDARTIEAFSTRLRQQVDLDALTSELLAVVDQAMQPTRVALWLRPSRAASNPTGRPAARR